MLGSDFYIILSFFLLAVLGLIGVYGVIGYRMYLKQNEKQYKDVVNDYKNLADKSHESLEKGVNTMLELIKHIEELKIKK